MKCERCLFNDRCDAQSASGNSELKKPIELELHSDTKLTRLVIGKCVLSKELVAIDYGKVIDGASGEQRGIGLQDLRLKGLSTIEIDLEQTLPAHEASTIVTEALRAIDFKPR